MNFAKIFLLVFILGTNVYAYKDMSAVSLRASELNMTASDYAFSMAISGVLTGTMFGLFLWKSR